MSRQQHDITRREIKQGMMGEIKVRVTTDMTASAYGNEGVDVLATPRLIHLIESASVLAIRDSLHPGESTVGTRLEVAHLAATPIGIMITVRATLCAVDGRRLTFETEAHDEVDLIAKGTHERVVIDLARFLARAESKKSRTIS
jgi:predicted thioesterase